MTFACRLWISNIWTCYISAWILLWCARPVYQCSHVCVIPAFSSLLPTFFPSYWLSPTMDGGVLVFIVASRPPLPAFLTQLSHSPALLCMSLTLWFAGLAGGQQAVELRKVLKAEIWREKCSEVMTIAVLWVFANCWKLSAREITSPAVPRSSTGR